MFANYIHPPLYFLLVHFWMKLPFGMDPVVQLRIPSAIYGLGAAIVADRFWARHWTHRPRICFLLFWVFSPCLVLYSRMARSYSLQMLVTLAAARQLAALVETPRRGTLWLYSAALALVLYTHYIPGVALAITDSVLLAARRRWRDALVSGALAPVLYLPWPSVLGASLRKCRSTRAGIS